MGVSKESISKFLIGNRFHVKLRILSPYSNSISIFSLSGPCYLTVVTQKTSAELSSAVRTKFE